MSIDNPYESWQTDGQPPTAGIDQQRQTAIACFGLICCALGLAVALLLPANRSVTEAGRRNTCANNLRQIGLALLNYEAVYHTLPPAYTLDADGKPLHSWRTLILPFIERHDIYEKIDLSKPWDDPANHAALEIPIHVFQCPSRGCPPTHTTYFAVVAPGGCFLPTEGRKLADITDDANLTLMVMETSPEKAVHWMCPSDALEPQTIDLGAGDKLAHPGAVQAVCVSGSVLIVSADSTPDRLRALISIAGADNAIAEAD